MTATYDLIASNVLTTSASSVTFSSIPATYRDLVLVAEIISASGDSYPSIRFNSDSGSNYSRVFAEGTGSVTVSSSGTSSDFFASDNLLATSTNRALHIFSVFDYAQTDKHKSILLRANAAASRVSMVAGRWASTSAINSITVLANINQFGTGSSFHLYGIVS